MTKIEKSSQYKDGKFSNYHHWATFNLSLHTWYDPMDRLTKSADSLGVLAATPVVGETTIYGEYIPTTKWWNEILAGKD